jgi:proline iminopeptidase
VPATLIDIGVTRLFVDDRGRPDAPPLLFVHGGPGQGCYDFMQAQGDRLARRLRVIGVDQRGALRSDPLPAAPALIPDLLIDDFEELRARLRLPAWTVLAHSAGSHYALRYVTSRPGAVRGVIFDCPVFDADLTDRYRLPEFARQLDAAGQHDDARRCRELAASTRRLTAADGTRAAMRKLGPRYQQQFFHDPDCAAAFTALLAASGCTPEQWDRGDSHAPLAASLYESVLGLLPEVRCPSMLIRGRDDLVTTPQMLAEYAASVPSGLVRVLADAGHFGYFEQPDEYCRGVTDFVVESTQRIGQ